jgi:Holliday junction resolvase RusA-like endonuclease
MTSYGFRVYGIPAPQGSKIPGVSSKTGKMFVREQSGKTLKSWREDVKNAALIARGIQTAGPDADGLVAQAHDVKVIDTLAGAIRLGINFYMPRPASVSVKKRPLPIVAPDLDKLVRGVGDALKAAGVYKDDAQVVSIQAVKVYGTDEAQSSPGAWIVISEIPNGITQP